MGEETDLRVVVGDLCPLPEVLGLLRRFFDRCPSARLHLFFEALSGPWERLFGDEQTSSSITSIRATNASNSSISAQSS
jgi:hypothetical protein